MLNAVSVEMNKEFQLSAQQFGQFFGIYTLGNLAFLFPAGLLLDRFSVRTLLLFSFVLSVVSGYLFSILSDLNLMLVARFFGGVAAAFSFLSAVKLASRWFEPRHMALVVGMIVTVAMFGGWVSQAPLTILTAQVGWRSAMQLVAYLGVALILLQFLIVRDEPAGAEKEELAEHQSLTQENFLVTLLKVLANKQNWLAGLYVSLVNLPVFIIGGVWGGAYLTQMHSFSQLEATGITGMIFVGLIFGSPLAGLVSDKMGLRKLPMIIGGVLTIAILAAITFMPTMSWWVEMVLYFILGVICSAQVIGYPVIAESNPHAITATATSLGSMLIVGGGTLAPIYGWLLEKAGSAQVVDGVTVYTAADFLRANSMMLVCAVIALGVAFLIKETYCKPLNRE